LEIRDKCGPHGVTGFHVTVGDMEVHQEKVNCHIAPHAKYRGWPEPPALIIEQVLITDRFRVYVAPPRCLIAPHSAT
jgi:hypothetical protein